MILAFGLLATGALVAISIRRGSAHRWAGYSCCAALAASVAFAGGTTWYDTVLCTAYSNDCDLGLIFGILWALVAACTCLAIGSVLEMVRARRVRR